MTLEAALFAYLSGVSAVTALVGTRIYPLAVPQGSDNYPAITYQAVSFPHVDSLTGSSGLAYPRVQITCWARDVVGGARGHTTALAVRDAVRNAMDGATGTWGGVGGVNVQRSYIVDEGDIFDPAEGVEANRTYGRRMDFEIWHAESQPTF